MKKVRIAGKSVGQGSPCLVIVDAGVNHNNDLSRALELVDKAARAGADVIKFQTYKARTITTRTAPRYWDPKLDTDGGGTQYDTFSRIDDLPFNAYRIIRQRCEREGIIFSSTPFNLDDVDLLERLDTPVYKISSSDITYHQLLRKVARKMKPIILSTGTATIGDIEEAVGIIREEGNKNLVLQHCILSYPCKDADVNLEKMMKIQQIFSDIPVGFSDHTLGTVIPLAAVAMGACSIEKHYTVDKNLPDSPDHSLSVDPEELSDMVRDIRRIEKSRGSFIDGHYPAEHKAYLYARKSIVAKVDIRKGTVLSESMLTCKRPGTGIYPRFMHLVTGRKAKTHIKADTTLTFEHIH